MGEKLNAIMPNGGNGGHSRHYTLWQRQLQMGLILEYLRQRQVGLQQEGTPNLQGKLTSW